MKRVFCGAFATETNTFGPLPTERRHFEEWFLYPAGTHPDEPTLFTGHLTSARAQASKRDWHVIEGLCTAAFPSGRLTRSTYDEFAGMLLEDVKAALPLDIIMLGLHGAMAAVGEDDCEGDLLQRVRALVGPDCVIGVELDPHCHLTDRMSECADVLLAYQEYPHTDSLERAQRLLDLCDRASRGAITPTTAILDLRMSAQFFTQSEPALSIVEMMRAMEADGRALAASLGHSFASGDVSDMTTKVFVVTDNDIDTAVQCVREIGDAVWEVREAVDPKRLTASEAIAMLPDTAGLTILAEGADNPGGGAPGDATGLLAAVMEAGIQGVAAGPIWDPAAVAICQAQGEGAKFALRLGGKACALSGLPLDLDVEVIKISHDVVQSFTGGGGSPLGTVVGVRCEGAEIAISNLRNQALTPDLFEAAGIDYADKRVLLLKSNHHFSHAFGPLADQIWYMDTPGVAVVNPLLAPYDNITRPLWPLDAADNSRAAQTVRTYA